MHPRQWLLALGAAVLAAAPLSAQTLTAGPEILVSAGSFEHPRETAPALAVGPDGGFLSAWLDHGVRVRGVSPANVPLAPARKLSSTTFPDPAVVAVGPGRYVAVWAEGTVLPQILGQILDAAGAPVGSPLVLANAAVSPVVAPHPAGGFVVSWTDNPDFPPPPPFLPVQVVRHFDAQAQPVGDEIPLGSLHQVSNLAVLPGGGFAVVSARFLIPADAGSIEVHLRVFAPDGTPAGPQITLSPDAENPWLRARVAADSAGRFVVAWTEYPPPDNTTTMQVWAQRFSPAGQPLGPPILAAEKSGFYAILGDVAVRPDGSFLIEWGETPAVSSDFSPETGDVLARAFDAAGTPLGPPLLVHTAQDGERHESEGEAEATAEGWIVSWIRFSHAQTGVYARRLSLSCGTGNELCLHGGRFRATAHWKTSPLGPEGPGRPLGLTSDTGAFWFFAPTNLELTVKVLDGRGVNGHFWVFFGSLTNVEFDLTVTDTSTGQQRVYHNPAGTMASRADTEAF